MILANMTILYGSASHTVWSVLLTFGSVAFYFSLFCIFSFVRLSTLDHQFQEIITFPTYHFNLVLFFCLTFPIDCFLHFVAKRQRESSEWADKQHKKEEKKKFVKGLDPNKLAPLRRRKLLYSSNSWVVYRYWVCVQWGGRTCATNYR